MIYSASRRTDMVAFYPDAIVDKVRRSRKLEAIVFWTKDIRNLGRHFGLASVVSMVPSVVQFTVTGLAGSEWEKNVPDLEAQLPDLADLAARLPRGAIRWRFDPVIPIPDVEERFLRVKSRLESVLGNLEQVTLSFPAPYPKAVERTVLAGLEWPRPDMAERTRLIDMMAGHFSGAGSKTGRRPICLCCEEKLLTNPLTEKARCVDGGLFETLYGLPLGDLKKDAGQRVACGCIQSTDIGSYAMRCRHQCLYCYACPE